MYINDYTEIFIKNPKCVLAKLKYLNYLNLRNSNWCVTTSGNNLGPNWTSGCKVCVSILWTFSVNSRSIFRCWNSHLIAVKSFTPHPRSKGLMLLNRPFENENAYNGIPIDREISLIGFQLVRPARSWAKFCKNQFEID